MGGTPNPRLQRTPSASPPSPLSRKLFGGTRLAVIAGLALIPLMSTAGRAEGARSRAISKAMAQFEARHPGVLHVGGEVKPPKVVQRVAPDWQSIPDRKRTYRGPIIVEAVITEKGQVVDPSVVGEVQPNHRCHILSGSSSVEVRAGAKAR